MDPVYVKEQCAYTKKQLYSKLGFLTANATIKKLKEYGVLKTIKVDDSYFDLSELEDLEIIVDEDDTETDYRYVFKFVGVIIVNGIVLICYPKYIFGSENPFEEMKQILEVLEKYNSKEQVIKMYVNNQIDNEFNRLAVMIYFLNDYYNNGVYSNFKDVIETNGSGEINWNKTINETYALLLNDQPYYTELQTIKRQNDDFDYFKRLHEYILTLCSKELKESSLLDIFGLTEVELSNENIDDFGDKDYILNQIEKEISVQFNTHKLALLKSMHMFINDDGTLLDNSTLSLYGTNSFNLVWEKVCAEVLDNKFDSVLKSEIEHPKWYDKNDRSQDASKTLTPDIVSIIDNMFIIFDAKYYNIILEPGKSLNGNPGVGDVTKQFLYQLAFKPYIENNKYCGVRNCFLMPTENEQCNYLGYVTMDMFKNLKLENIKVVQLPAKIIYGKYLTNDTYKNADFISYIKG